MMEVIQKLVAVAKDYYNISIGEDDLKILFQISEIKQYKAGDVLCEVGDKINHTGFVLDGIIRSAFVTYDGKDITRFFHTQYAMVLDDVLLGFSESKYRCVTVSDATVLMIPSKKLRDLIDTNRTFGQIYCKALESGLRYKIYRENELMTKSATERYRQFVKDFPELVAKVKQRDIATYLGIEPESLSRIKGKLSENQHPDNSNTI
ncbi:MAG: Crp/Fnr family transcriptional regulator [Coprococcus sp.]